MESLQALRETLTCLEEIGGAYLPYAKQFYTIELADTEANVKELEAIKRRLIAAIELSQTLDQGQQTMYYLQQVLESILGATYESM